MNFKLIILILALAFNAIAQTNAPATNAAIASTNGGITLLPSSTSEWIIKTETHLDTNWQMAIVQTGNNYGFYVTPGGRMLQIGMNGVSNQLVLSRWQTNVFTNSLSTTNYPLPDPPPTRWVQAEFRTNNGTVQMVGWKVLP